MNRMFRLAKDRPILREVKRKVLTGEKQVFEIEFWARTEKSVIGRWVAKENNPFGAEPESYSWGVWPLDGRNFGAYRFHMKNHELKGYRFDCLEDSKFAMDKDGPVLTFMDLIIDSKMRCLPDDSVQVELQDEDELEDAVKQGMLSDQQRQVTRTFQNQMLTDPFSFCDFVDEQIDFAIRTVEEDSRSSAEAAAY